jgi:hypothetical protein
MMNKLLPVILLLLMAVPGFAQQGNDSLIYNLPTINNKLVYTDSIIVQGRDSIMLDSMAKKWFNSYYADHQPDTIQGKNIKSSVVAQGILLYNVTPGLISIPFYAVVSVQINCRNNGYTYKMFNIHFRPKNGVVNAIGYQNDPDYLIKLYKQKHIGLITSMNINRGMIRKYLAAMNNTVQTSIAALNKAMTN